MSKHSIPSYQGGIKILSASRFILDTMAPRYNEPCYNKDPVIIHNI